MALTVARCIMSLRFKIRPRYLNNKILWIGYEQGWRSGRVSTRGRGPWLGQADVVPPGRRGGQGFRERPLFLCCLY